MNMPSAPPASFLARLRNAGIEATDSEETRLNKSLLVFATGLVTIASILWLMIYEVLGPNISATVPFAYQLLLAGNLLIYARFGNFNLFRTTQLALFLFAPFAIQWSLGNFIAGSGIVLWGLLAPIGAVLFFGVRQSQAWFVAWVALTALSGAADYYALDLGARTAYQVPQRTSVVFFALNFISVAAIIYMLLRFSIQEKNKAKARMEETHALLQAEQANSERLLLNILPAQVATRLKTSSDPIADGFADVSVMFADIVNFTQVASNMSPSQVFAMLNRVFSAFDDLVESHGLEKIKTIGDAYMVAAGLDARVEDYSATLADLAIEMRDLLRADPSINASHLDIRIGIGTGPLVAGVVGKKKFVYDLWGDTVNLASRITTEGVPGMIQCDSTTHRRLRDKFDFHEPQTLYLKGIGNLTVYRLIGRKQRAVRPEAATPA